MANIIVCIDPKSGETTFEVNGIKGSGCTAITDALAAGREVEDEGVTEDMHYREALPDYV